MTIAEQALSLLDILPSITNRRKLDNFGNLDRTISASFPGSRIEEEGPITASEENPFAMASRMGRSDYEDQARAEALTEALRQLRAKNSRMPSARVLRQP